MKSKLGFHVDILTYPGQPEQMIAAGTKVIKVIESMGLLQHLHGALGDQTTFIARAWPVGDDFLRFGGHHDPKAAAVRWFNAMLPVIRQAPFAYWESFNEMSSWDHLAAYGEFEAERQRIMADHGYKCCIGNFAVGTPEIADSGDVWPRFYPALSAAHRYKNILGLHEYGGLWMDLWYGPNTGLTKGNKRQPFPAEYAGGWLFGRYRKVWRKHIQTNGWTDIRIALTEFGLDMAGTSETSVLTGQTVGAWKSCIGAWERLDGRRDPEQYYFEQLRWADTQMQRDPYLIGATIFTWGTFPDSLWINHDIQGGVAERLIAYIKSTTDDTKPPIEPPTVDYPDITYLRSTATPSLRLRSGKGSVYPVVGAIMPDDILVTTLPPEHIRPTSWVPVVTEDGKAGYASGTYLEVVA